MEQHPFQKLSDSELKSIAEDIQSAKIKKERPKSLLPYAIDIYENLNGTNETTPLRECIDMARTEFYETVSDRFIKNQTEITVSTPKGIISAKIMPDDEYLGIGLLYKKQGSGEPGAIMEYDPNKEKILMRIYSKEDPDGNPAAIYDISETEQMYYYDIHVHFGHKDNDGYSIPIAVKDGTKQDAIQKAKKEHRFEMEDDDKWIDYVEQISEKDYLEMTSQTKENNNK